MPVVTPDSGDIAGRRPLVLLVDDACDLRFVARLLLEDAGYEVIEAVNGIHALEQLRERLPDVLVTDIDMPGMNGIELLTRLKADPDVRAIPVVAWAERPPESLPFDATLAKGLGVSALGAHLDRLVRGAHRGST